MMTDWYQKSMNALALNGKAGRTQQAYSRALRMLCAFHGNKQPEDISEQELEAYFLHRRNVDHWSANTLRICYCGIRFYFVHVLRREWNLFNFLRAKSESRLSAVLSREEVRAVLDCVRTPHNRAYLSTVYACGLRLQERALSPIFRAKFRDAMAAAGLLAQIDAAVWALDWNVNCQPVGDAQASLKYLSRYVFKVGISEGRIVRASDAQVVFRYRQVNSQRQRTMALAPAEFIRRFLQHVLPPGFMKVRYFGFLSPSFSMPIEAVKGRIELAQGFTLRTPQLSPAAGATARAGPLPYLHVRCVRPRSGARARGRVVPCQENALRIHLHSLEIASVKPAKRQRPHLID